MTSDEALKDILREQGVYPPSVLDPHYSDTPELTSDEIIIKTLREVGMALSLNESGLSSHEATQLSIIVARVRQRLPGGNIKTCGAFKHLNASLLRLVPHVPAPQ